MRGFYLTLIISSVLFSNQLLAQTCNSTINPNAPTTRYSSSIDGTTVDNLTGLMWMRCAVGQTWDGSSCTGSALFQTYSEALRIAADALF
jgi:hypothetical protein